MLKDIKVRVRFSGYKIPTLENDTLRIVGYNSNQCILYVTKPFTLAYSAAWVLSANPSLAKT